MILKKLRYLLLGGCWLFTAIVWAETACPPDAIQPDANMVKAGVANARDHGYLWRISKAGQHAYLYGTIHVAKQEWMYPGQTVKQALLGADTIALELDMLDAGMLEKLTQGLQNMPKGAIAPDLTERLQKQASALCIPAQTLAHYSPEMQAITLSLMVGRWDNLHAAFGIDAILASLAHAMLKTVVSLETPESQLAALTLANPTDMVTDTLRELESGHARLMLNRLATAWSDSNFAELDSFYSWCECLNTASEQEMMKKLMDERNPLLADKIDSLITQGKQVFAAVGSLHFFGNGSIIELLQAKGYTIERVIFPVAGASG